MFKTYNQQQNFLLPPSYDEYLGENHESKLLSNIVESLHLDFLEKSYKNQEKGTSSYHPKMLLKVLFYAYMNGIFSSRKIANKLKSDLGFMYLSGNNTPDFRTINNFRKQKGKYLEQVFVEIVYLAENMGIIKFGTLSLDGSKFYANASKQKNYDIKRLQKTISGLFDEAEKIDTAEEKEYGDKESHIPEEYSQKDKQKEALEKAKKKYEELQEQLKEKQKEDTTKGKKPRKNINSTDRDCRLMQMKRKDFGNGYNMQIITEQQFIIGNYVSNNPGDAQDFIPTLKKLKETFHKQPKRILADKGYASIENYTYLKENKILGYIPHPENNGDSLEDFTYDETEDIFIDILGRKYCFKQYMGRKYLSQSKGRGRPRKEEKILQIPENYQAKLYVTTLENGEKKHLYVNQELKEVYGENDKRLLSEEGKEIYKKRSGDVEPVFGNMKFNLGFERFLLRSLEGVQIETNLITLVHNLKKIMKFQAG